MIGKTLGNCQIMEELGRGGMAVVYKAYQPSLNRYVAVKVLPPQLGVDREFVERFQREARAAAGLRHPNIVVIHDVGHDEGVYYIVMEYLEGRTLKKVIDRESPMSPGRVQGIVEQVGKALDYAHRRGFIHRDVKPSNIFVGEGDRITLTDFGIAKAASEGQQLTREGILMGTPEYMSPEQASGGKVDHRTDLYALGVVLYQMVVGRTPFRGATPHATLHAVIYESPPPPRQVNPRVTPALESVVMKAVAKKPGDRFQSGAEMGSALNSAASKREEVAAVPPPPRRPAPTEVVAPRQEAQPSDKRSPVVWILAAIAAVLVVLLGVLLVLAFRASDGGGTAALPTTPAIAWKTPTTDAGGAVPTATKASTATTSPGTDVLPTETAETPETPLPPTDTPAAATDTSEPPTDTSEPPTHTPPPTSTFTPTPTTPPPPPSCSFPAQGTFSGLWQNYKEQLGCPLYQSPQLINDAEQAFDNGHMFWRQDNDYAYVVYEQGGLNGTYQAYTDMWHEGDPAYSCAASPPPGRVQPVRGFGAVWCHLGGPSAAIGWGLGEEAGFWPGNADPMVQDFERGFIFRDSDGTTKGMAYVFFSDSGTFVRVHY